MSLFGNIHTEIEEMFLGCMEIPTGTLMGKRIALAIIREIQGRQENESYIRTNQLLRWAKGEMLITKSRFDSFYKKAGQIITAYELLKTGLYSGREVRKIVGISHAPITKLFKKDLSLVCVCGKPLRFHRGCCAHRFLKSEKRQIVMDRLHQKRANGRFS